jgi:hypothetical protein
MQLYNKIMLFFWLFIGVLIFVIVTYMGFTEKSGFKIWAYYYLFSGLSFLMYFVRRWMMKRMEKHLKYMAEKEASEE